MSRLQEIANLHECLYDSVADRNEKALLETISVATPKYQKPIIGFIICLLDNACRDDFVWICYYLIKNNQSDLVLLSFINAYELPVPPPNI